MARSAISSVKTFSKRKERKKRFNLFHFPSAFPFLGIFFFGNLNARIVKEKCHWSPWGFPFTKPAGRTLARVHLSELSLRRGRARSPGLGVSPFILGSVTQREHARRPNTCLCIASLASASFLLLYLAVPVPPEQGTLVPRGSSRKPRGEQQGRGWCGTHR